MAQIIEHQPSNRKNPSFLQTNQTEDNLQVTGNFKGGNGDVFDFKKSKFTFNED